MSYSELPLRKMSVLVAEDSDLMRSVLNEIIDDSLDFRVVAQARTGYETIRLLHDTNPDVVTLDLQMPSLSGLEVLGYIMSEAPRPVIIVSAHVSDMGEPAMTALEYGALEIVAKPSGDDLRDVDMLADRLLEALRAAAAATITNLRVRERVTRRAQAITPAAAQTRGARCAIALAASTGGPRALTEIVPRLPSALQAAVLVVQHMPAPFTRVFAERLAGISEVPVQEGVDGQIVHAGNVYIAPGGAHMSLRRTAAGITLALEETDPVWGVRPAADVLFSAVARHYGPASGGVVLTGMGRDGAEGLRAIKEVGGWTAVQDAASSVVYGMPRMAAPYAADELTLEQVPEVLAKKSVTIARKRGRQWKRS